MNQYPKAKKVLWRSVPAAAVLLLAACGAEANNDTSPDTTISASINSTSVSPTTTTNASPDKKAITLHCVVNSESLPWMSTSSPSYRDAQLLPGVIGPVSCEESVAPNEVKAKLEEGVAHRTDVPDIGEGCLIMGHDFTPHGPVPTGQPRQESRMDVPSSYMMALCIDR